MTAAFLIDSIPLQDPLDGWKANHGFWIQFFIGNLVVGAGTLLQVKEIVPLLNMTLCEIALIAVPSSISAVALYMGSASLWAFPVPFGLVLISGPFIIMLVFFFMLVIGRKRFQNNPNIGRQLRDQIGILAVQSSLAVVYPGFGAIYNAIPSSYRPFFTFAFPLLKVCMSNAIAYVSHDLESMPEVTLTSVEVFNALYVVKCMQNSVSRLTYVAILAFDLFESVMVFRDLQAQTEQIGHLLHKTPDQTLPQRVLELCLEPGVLNSRTGSSIKLRSHMKVAGPKMIEGILQSLEIMSQLQPAPLLTAIKTSDQYILDEDTETETCAASKPAGPEYASVIQDPISKIAATTTATMASLQHTTNRKHTSPTRNACCTVRHKIWPSPQAVPPKEQSRGDIKQRPITLAEKHFAVEKALQMISQCEFHALTEYIECIIPLMYSVHMTILYHLPNCKYYVDMAHMTPTQLERTMLNIFLYAWIEVLSLLALQFVIKRQMGFSPACVLAFVLENQFFEFQGRLVVWYLFVLVFTLYHCGIDFTLRFEWLDQSH